MSPTESRLAELAREALAARPGLRTSQLRRALPASARAWSDDVARTLRAMAARGEAWRVATSKDEAFFALDPIETLDRLVPRLLVRPLSAQDLRTLIERHAPGHGVLARQWLQSATARGLLTRTTPQHDLDAAVVLRAVETAASAKPPGTLLLVGKVRSLAPEISKEAFDAAALDLARVRKVVLHRHDHPAWLTPEERAQLVHAAGTQDFYIGIAPSDRLIG